MLTRVTYEINLANNLIIANIIKTMHIHIIYIYICKHYTGTFDERQDLTWNHNGSQYVVIGLSLLLIHHAPFNWYKGIYAPHIRLFVCLCAALNPIYCQKTIIYYKYFVLTQPAVLLQATCLSHSYLTYMRETSRNHMRYVKHIN